MKYLILTALIASALNVQASPDTDALKAQIKASTAQIKVLRAKMKELRKGDRIEKLLAKMKRDQDKLDELKSNQE